MVLSKLNNKSPSDLAKILIKPIKENDKFIDDIKKNHGGDVVFFAMTVDDYELMAFNTQEIRRYINQLGEVIVYYRNVTINDDEGGAIEIKVEKDGNN